MLLCFQEQNFKQHGHADCSNSESEKFAPWRDFGGEPMIAMRTYCIAETALVNCVYYHKYSQHRCNLALDTDLEVGVYGYTDAETTLVAISDGQTSTQQVVLGVLAGYMHKSQKKKGLKVSLDPRSCKLLGFSRRYMDHQEHLLCWEKKTRYL